MSEIFSPSQRYELWLRVELVVCEGWADLGEIPRSALERLRQARVDADHIARLEERVGHDVVAFLDSLAEPLGDDARYLHRGLTSSDVLDTALALQLVQAADILLKDVDRLSSVIRRRAVEERHTLMAGRTHGTVEPRVEEWALEKLGLKVAPVTTQVIARDRHAAYLTTLAVLAGGLEKFATDIRHLQRSEVSEVREPLGAEQKGSSAMPHKRNPVLSERICGLARVVRGYA